MAIVIKKMGVRSPSDSLVSIHLDLCPELKLLDHVAVLYLVFEES